MPDFLIAYILLKIINFSGIFSSLMASRRNKTKSLQDKD